MIVLLRRQEALRLRNGGAAKPGLSSVFLRKGQGTPPPLRRRGAVGRLDGMNAVALLFVSLLFATPASAAKSEAASKAACDVARQATADFVAQRPEQVMAGSVRKMAGLSEADFRTSAAVPPPPVALVRAYLGSADESALACPQVRELLDARGVRYGPEAEDEARAAIEAPLRTSLPNITLHTISLPVMSPDGRHALVGVSSRCRGLCGMMTVAYYRKEPDGSWRRFQAGPLILS
jgi:hypothetical protein